MIVLEADNRVLTQATKYSSLLTNYSSGVSAFSVLNATDSQFAVDVFLLLGNFGSENAEVVKILTVSNATGAITTTTATKFAHPESTRVTIIPYDQVRFFHTTDTTFVTTDPLTGYINIQPSDWFTTYNDEAYSDGYGWYIFYNSQTAIASQQSNPIPYTGFAVDTTEQILDDFFGMLNNRELKLVTRDEALGWASEAYSRMQSKLNLTNIEYKASAVTSLSIVSGTIEYDLPADFDHLVSFIAGLDTTDPGKTGGGKSNISWISLKDAYTYNGTGPRYYIRGSKIGVLPTPGSATTYHYTYQKKAARLTLNSDEVDLPDGGEYVIKDFMLYRAYKKFQNQAQSKDSFGAFKEGLDEMIISSVQRDSNLDTWGIAPEANV